MDYDKVAVLPMIIFNVLKLYRMSLDRGTCNTTELSSDRMHQYYVTAYLRGIYAQVRIKKAENEPMSREVIFNERIRNIPFPEVLPIINYNVPRIVTDQFSDLTIIAYFRKAVMMKKFLKSGSYFTWPAPQQNEKQEQESPIAKDVNFLQEIRLKKVLTTELYLETYEFDTREVINLEMEDAKLQFIICILEDLVVASKRSRSLIFKLRQDCNLE